MLLQENEELGKVISSGRTAKLEGEIALEKTLVQEMKKSQAGNYRTFFTPDMGTKPEVMKPKGSQSFDWITKPNLCLFETTRSWNASQSLCIWQLLQKPLFHSPYKGSSNFPYGFWNPFNETIFGPNPPTLQSFQRTN